MSICKIILFITATFLGIHICTSQEIRIRGGLNLSQFWWEYENVVGTPEGSMQNPGFNIGPVLDVPISKIFSIETGILYTSKGYRSSVESGGALFERRENLYYLDVPVLFKITLPVKKVGIFAMAGPYIGEALYGKDKYVSTFNSVTDKWEGKVHWGEEPDEYDRFDYGLKFGTGLRYNMWQMGACYELGLKNISNMNREPYLVLKNNRVLEFYLSYTLINLKSNKK
jgi:hypothetical protein